MESKKLKAYIVSNNEYSRVVFATSPGKARASVVGCYEFDDTPFIELIVKRAIYFDKYKYSKHKKVPIKALLEDGFSYMCNGCESRRVYYGSLARGAKIIGDQVYCEDCAKELNKDGK